MFYNNLVGQRAKCRKTCSAYATPYCESVICKGMTSMWQPKYCDNTIILNHLGLLLLLCNLDCSDTPEWDNRGDGSGFDCKEYAEKKWCENGAARPGHEDSLGSKHNYPENNCCVCGKGKGTGICTLNL